MSRLMKQCKYNKKTTIHTGNTTKKEYRKPFSNPVDTVKGKREVCRQLSKEEINKLYGSK